MLGVTIDKKLYRNRAAAATRAEPNSAVDGLTATPALEPLEVSSAALEALAAESAVVDAESLAGACVSIVRSLPESESPTVTSSSELAEDVVFVGVGATVTSSAVSSEAEDVAATELADPVEAEDVVDEVVEAEADVAALELVEVVEAVVDELELPAHPAVTGVIRSAYSANVPTVHSSGNIVVRSDSTSWQAELEHIVLIWAAVGVLSEDGE